MALTLNKLPWYAQLGMFLALSIAGAGSQSVAWEAHVGGFLAGLLLFSAFDPMSRPASTDDPAVH